jgi:hypothetical protein
MSIRTSLEPLRKARASAREMLIEAAAQKWGGEKSQCREERGAVVNAATSASLTYGRLAEVDVHIVATDNAPGGIGEASPHDCAGRLQCDLCRNRKARPAVARSHVRFESMKS